MKWNPEDYAKNSDAQLKWAKELKQSLNLQGDESVLDVGCGDGKITANFATTLPRGRVVGIDSSPDMIAYATRTYAAHVYPNQYSLVLMHVLSISSRNSICAFQMRRCTGLTITKHFLQVRVGRYGVGVGWLLHVVVRELRRIFCKISLNLSPANLGSTILMTFTIPISSTGIRTIHYG